MKKRVASNRFYALDTQEILKVAEGREMCICELTQGFDLPKALTACKERGSSGRGGEWV